ncbi:MAG: hypothetical protein M3N31_07310 [Actinomycetota bacterium]|nr:hypothetical protein [Actinomycetota bacterium]
MALLLLASTLALVAHDPPSPAPPAPAPVDEGLSARALEDLAASGMIPGEPSPDAGGEGDAPPGTEAPAATPKPGETRPARPPLGGPAGVDAYRGLGTWVDVYDWTRTYARQQPRVLPADVDRMAALGVQTLYIQASKHDAPGDLVEPELLAEWIQRARSRGIRVVAWYLPTLVDPARDLARMMAIAGLPVDGLAVDIEAKDVSLLGERNRRLVAFSASLRRALPGRVIGGIVLPPVVLDVVNALYWPSFPYRQLAPYYDVWMTMGYWTVRPPASAFRDAHRYTSENVSRLRSHLGLPNAPVHPIGGIGDRSTVADVARYRQAAIESGSIGGSLYDWRTTRLELWAPMQGLRA